MVRRAWALVRRVFCPACWCSSHSVRLRRRLAVHRLVLLGEPVQLAGDGDGAGAEQVLHVLADAADLGAVAVGPGHHDVAEGGQLGLQDPVGDRGDGEPLVVQAARVQRPPLGVGAVGALDPVPDRHVHVQLRVAVAGQVVQEQARGQPGAVAPLPRARRVVAGAGVGRVLLEPGDGFARGVHQRGLDLIGARVERGGAVLVAALAGLPGRDPVGGVQHRDALDRADGQVEVRHLVRVLGPFGGADLGQLGRAGVRVRGPVRRHRGGFAVRGRLGLAPLDQELPAGSGVLLVQALDDVRVHHAAQAERRGALPGPLPRRFPGRGVVRHGPGAAAAVLAAGEVGHVVARVQGDVSRHDPLPPAGSAFIVRDACVRLVLITNGRYVRRMHNLRISRRRRRQSCMSEEQASRQAGRRTTTWPARTNAHARR